MKNQKPAYLIISVLVLINFTSLIFIFPINNSVANKNNFINSIYNTEKENEKFEDINYFKNPQSSSVNWWNNSFCFRKRVNITNPYSNSLFDYPAKLSFYYNDLVQSGKIRPDLKDIRVVENNVLKNYFYLKDYPTIGQVTVWFDKDIDSGPGHLDQETYLYYGNDSIGIDKNFFMSNRFGMAWYSFEEGSGKIVYDSSSNGNDGTLNGPSWVAGKMENYALNFDGIDDYVQISDSDTISPMNDISISFWVFIKGASQTAIRKDTRDYMFEFGEGGSTNSGTTPQFYIRTSTGYTFIYGNGAYSSLNLNQWYHCVGIYNYQTGAKMFINGIEATISAPTPQLGTIYDEDSYLRIGNWGSEIFNGTIDDVKIFNHSLSIEELRWIYNLSSPLDTDLNDEESLSILNWQFAGNYKGYPLMTPEMKFNPSKSNYLVVISPLLSQAGYIEEAQLEGVPINLTSYRKIIEEAIIATLEAHPDAYIYVMDKDLGHIFNEFLLMLDLYGLHIYTYKNNEIVPISLNKIFGNILPILFYEVWLKYRDFIQLKILDIHENQNSHVNTLILGNSIEFPEYLKVSWPDPEWLSEFGRPKYFSDILYMLRDNKLLGGIGRISIEQADNYFQNLKDITFQKKYHIAGSDLINLNDNTDDLIEIKNIFDEKGGYTSNFVVYNDFVTYLEMADFIISGFHGLSFKGPKIGSKPAYKVEFDPSLFIAYSCEISNSIIYDYANSKICRAYSEQVNNKGVTLFSNTFSGYINLKKILLIQGI